MTDLTELSDAAIRSMLRARADRAARFRLDPAAIVIAAGPRARRSPPGAGFFGRAPVAASAIAAAIVVAVLVGSPLLDKSGASQAPTGSGSATSARFGSVR